jgi:hypothetical protein
VEEAKGYDANRAKAKQDPTAHRARPASIRNPDRSLRVASASGGRAANRGGAAPPRATCAGAASVRVIVSSGDESARAEP